MTRWLKAVITVSVALAVFPTMGHSQDSRPISTSVSAIAEIAECNEIYLNYGAKAHADMITQMPTQAEQLRYLAQEKIKRTQERGECLARMKGNVDATTRAKLDVALADNAREVAATFDTAARMVEANPKAYIDLSQHFGSSETAKHRATLAGISRLPTLAGMCGRLNLSQPATLDVSVNARSAQYHEWEKCFDRWASAAAKWSIDMTSFETRAKYLLATERFTCSRLKRPNCISDDAWRDYGGPLATAANLAMVKAADKRHHQLSLESYGERERAREWARTLTARIRRQAGQ